MIYLLLSLIIGASSALVVWVVFVVQKDLSPNTLRRLERIKRRADDSGESDEKYELDLSKEYIEYKIQALGGLLKDFKITSQIKDMIRLSDVNWHVDTFILLSFLCAIPCLMFLVTPFKLMALFSLGCLFIPMLYLKHLINQRALDFSKQFPDALNLMASSLRAGHPLVAAIDMVTGEMPKPISDVFATTQKDMALGVDTKDAFYSMTKVMPQSIDLRFFITAVLIQKEVGGNLAELLDSLSATIRERFKLLGQLRVQTAQTRLSGMIIAVVPAIVLIAVFIMNPEYIKPLFETHDGKIAFGIAVFMSIAGFISIKKLSNVEM